MKRVWDLGALIRDPWGQGRGDLGLRRDLGTIDYACGSVRVCVCVCACGSTSTDAYVYVFASCSAQGVETDIVGPARKIHPA